MELEKQRGISITSTVLSFEYNGNHINLLDTPGHQVQFWLPTRSFATTYFIFSATRQSKGELYARFFIMLSRLLFPARPMRRADG